MKELLMLERMVIESIAKGEKSLKSIQLDTGLDYSLVLSIAAKLLQRGLVDYKYGEYSVSKNDINWQKVNRDDSIKNEIKEVSDNMIDIFFDDRSRNKLKLQKVYINKQDEKILNSLLNSVENFVNDLRKDQKVNNVKVQTKDQKVLMWGYGDYQDLVQNTLKVVS
ncbi:MAG: hypothetical protein BM556_13850 [Bacteriovorax sp. MedPE-SWde]|nr:MAG: hypothetical protein BM556_13850 [Bacteriovorax sp. MedPE-SWde]